MNAIASSTKIRSKKKLAFNAQAFLNSAGLARKIVEYRKSEKIYTQGESINDVLYIQKGEIKLSVINEVGKEAVVAMLGPGDFFGEGGLAGQLVRVGTATAIAPTTLLVIEKKRWFVCSTRNMHSLTDSWHTCLRETSELSRIWLISCLTPARNGWLAPFYYLLIMASKTSPKNWSPKYRKKPWRKLSGQHAAGSISS